MSFDSYNEPLAQSTTTEGEENREIATTSMNLEINSNMYLLKIKAASYSVISYLFPSSTFTKFLITGFIPILSDQLIPLFYKGQLPNESSLAIAGQYTFISVILEVIQEGIVNSLFHFVGKNYKNKREDALRGLKICFYLLIVLGSLLAAILIIFIDQFVNLIQTPAEIAAATRKFLLFSSLSFPLLLFNTALINYFYITTSSYLVVSQIIQAILTFLWNFFLFGKQNVSLHWDLDYLGFYNIIQSATNLLTNILFFHCFIEKVSLKTFWWDISVIKNLRTDFNELFLVSWGNFGDSLIRNFFYFMVTLKFINSLSTDEIGAWNLLNTIIWSIILLPTFAIGNYIRVLIGHISEKKSHTENENSNLFKEEIYKILKEALVCLGLWILIFGTISGLFWPNLASYFSESNEKVQKLSTKMFYELGWVFIIFSLNNTIDSIFYGTGQTSYVFYQSFITNLAVYLVPWILYEFGYLVPTYLWVIGTYISGMIIDFIITIFFYYWLMKRLL